MVAVAVMVVVPATDIVVYVIGCLDVLWPSSFIKWPSSPEMAGRDGACNQVGRHTAKPSRS